MTKALMEKLVRSEDYISNSKNVITRYGNVIGSRGSVIPQFIDSIKSHGYVNITHPQMTRFMMSLEESVELVLFALQNGSRGDLFVQKSPSASVEVIVEALKQLLDKKDIQVRNIGIRPGEKIHETLLTSEELSLAVEHEKYFQVTKQAKSLNSADMDKFSWNMEYTSATTKNLTVDELVQLLIGIPLIKNAIGTS
jgi:UDP-glucose 4-epimerase